MCCTWTCTAWVSGVCGARSSVTKGRAKLRLRKPRLKRKDKQKLNAPHKPRLMPPLQLKRKVLLRYQPQTLKLPRLPLRQWTKLPL